MRVLSQVAMIAMALAALASQAAVTATEAWVRGTVPAQKTTGAFVTLQSTTEAKLVAVTTPAASSAQIHASEDRHGVMHMHAVDTLRLPAGQRVELKPGGFHIMLFGLKAALGAGESVPLTFTFEDVQGQRSRVEVRAEVRPLGR
ncbi:MAG TPA: copper chaperone PCu(A)C [Usitatibacter sp.]|nr:copper chaperone PCu(A)C [Usitatibacter sp.]